ncbi:MAG: peptidyl-prolyl cis-trans isomerase [Polyangiaceae bacterium]
MLKLALLTGVLPVWLLACQNSSPASSTSDSSNNVQAVPQTPDTLAVVNGVSIGRAELPPEQRAEGHKTGSAPETERQRLDRAIDEELASQRALAAGLDSDPTFREELAKREAALNAWKRQALAELYDHSLTGTVEVTDADARAYYDANEERIQTEVHVQQILVRDEKKVEELAARIANGESFEDVAASQFPNLPAAAKKPWDLGYLQWNQVPEPWRDTVYSAELGAVSGVLRGPSNRYWIVRVVARRQNPNNTFEFTQSLIIDLLKNDQRVATKQSERGDLRKGARIEYFESVPQASVGPHARNDATGE